MAGDRESRSEDRGEGPESSESMCPHGFNNAANCPDCTPTGSMSIDHAYHPDHPMDRGR